MKWLTKLFSHIFNREQFIFFGCKLDERDISEPLNYEQYRFEKIKYDSFEHDLFFHEKNRLKRFQNYFAANIECYGYIQQPNEVISYCWVTGSLHHDVEFFISKHIQAMLPSACVYIFDCYTKPQFQRQGLYKNSLISILRLYQKESFRQAYILCEVQNAASIKGIHSAGFEKYFNFSVYQLGYIHWLKLNSRFKFIQNKMVKDFIPTG